MHWFASGSPMTESERGTAVNMSFYGLLKAIVDTLYVYWCIEWQTHLAKATSNWLLITLLRQKPPPLLIRETALTKISSDAAGNKSAFMGGLLTLARVERGQNWGQYWPGRFSSLTRSLCVGSINTIAIKASVSGVVIFILLNYHLPFAASVYGRVRRATDSRRRVVSRVAATTFIAYLVKILLP